MADKSKSAQLVRELSELLLNLGLTRAEVDQALDLLLYELSKSKSSQGTRGVSYSKRLATQIAKKRLQANAPQAELDELSNHYYSVIIAVFAGVGSAALYDILKSLAGELKAMVSELRARPLVVRSDHTDTTFESVARPQDHAIQGTPKAQYLREQLSLKQSSFFLVVFDTMRISPVTNVRIMLDDASLATATKARVAKHLRDCGLLFIARRRGPPHSAGRKGLCLIADPRLVARISSRAFSGIEISDYRAKTGKVQHYVFVVGRAGIDDFGMIEGKPDKHGSSLSSPAVLSNKAHAFLVGNGVRFDECHPWLLPFTLL